MDRLSICKVREVFVRQVGKHELIGLQVSVDVIRLSEWLGQSFQWMLAFGHMISVDLEFLRYSSDIVRVVSNLVGELIMSLCVKDRRARLILVDFLSTFLNVFGNQTFAADCSGGKVLWRVQLAQNTHTLSDRCLLLEHGDVADGASLGDSAATLS